MIAVVSSLTLIFMIMLILTRSMVASLVIVATAGSSIAASFGISVLLWQDLFGKQVQWLVMLMSVIILLAVGSDYNLLLVSRFRTRSTPDSRPGSSVRWRVPAVS